MSADPRRCRYSFITRTVTLRVRRTPNEGPDQHRRTTWHDRPSQPVGHRLDLQPMARRRQLNASRVVNVQVPRRARPAVSALVRFIAKHADRTDGGLRWVSDLRRAVRAWLPDRPSTKSSPRWSSCSLARASTAMIGVRGGQTGAWADRGHMPGVPSKPDADVPVRSDRITRPG